MVFAAHRQNRTICTKNSLNMLISRNRHYLPPLLITSVIFALLLVTSGCQNKQSIYPQRPSAFPYYFNNTSITEIDLNVRYALVKARTRTGIEFVSVLLKTLPPGQSAELFAAGLFEDWRIGARTQGKGVLILFIEDTHTAKIEVSYQLESIFTDAFCSTFQPEIKSYFAGKFFGDVFCHFINCMEERIMKDERIEEELARLPKLTIKHDDAVLLSGGGGIIESDYYAEKEHKLALINDYPKEVINKYSASSDIADVVEKYLETLEYGINHPFLDILTQGSGMQRLEYPESAYFLRTRWKDYQRAKPYIIKEKGDLAVVRFTKANPLPFLLRRDSKGLWRIDVVKSWSYFWSDFVENDSGLYHHDHPWMFAFDDYGYRKSFYKLPELLPVDADLKAIIEELQHRIDNNPADADLYFKLADIFYWECYWLDAAITLLEKGLELDPDNIPYRWLLIKIRNSFPMPRPNINHYNAIIARYPRWVYAYRCLAWHMWNYERDYDQAIDILKHAIPIERKLNGNSKYSVMDIEEFKENYWKEVARDRSIFWKGFNYIKIFYL